jgi:o-succinylbenzoate---CoA ligase
VRPRLTTLEDDGSPAAATAILDALARALDGGPAVTVRPQPPTARRPTPLPDTTQLLETARPPTPHTVGASPDTPRTVAASPATPPPPGPPGELRDATAVVVTTSGSTGAPKHVELSADALRASATATHARLGGPGTWLLALPVQHIAGLQVLVRSLLAGTTPAVLDRGRPFTADAFAQLTAALPATGRRYTALVPTQLVRLLDTHPGRHALRAFDAILIGGAACPPELVHRARKLGAAIVTTYGMTETAGGCVYNGRPLDGVRLRLTDDALARPDGAHPTTNGPEPEDVRGRLTNSGRIELGGPTLALGYLDDPIATAAAFADGWFRSDDLGTLDASGTLDVLGRLDDMIVTGGIKIPPALVERALSATPGVAQACVVGLPDPEWGQLVAAAIQPSDPANPPDPSTLRMAARALAGPAATPKIIRFVEALPHRGPGKIDRTAVRALLARS